MLHPNTRFKNTNPQMPFWKGDYLACFFLAALGGAGLYYCFFAPVSQKENIKVHLPQLEDNRPSETTPKVDYKSSELDIRGAREANERLTFKIEAFEDKVTYLLDLGNGDTHQLVQPKYSYSYRKSGRYRVRLWGSFKNQKKLIHEEWLTVGKAIEVAPDAFFDLED